MTLIGAARVVLALAFVVMLSVLGGKWLELPGD